MRPPWAGPGSLSATPGNAGIRIVNVCLTPASSQAQLRCRVESMHWGPRPHRKRWSSAGGEQHHVAATPSGPLAVAGDWIHSRQVGSAVAWRLLASQSGLLPSARAIAKPPAPRHHPLFEELHRCCWLTSPEHRKQHYTLHTFRVSRASDCHNSVILDPTLSTCGTDRLPAPSLFSSLPQLHHLHHHHPPCPVRSAQQPPLQDVTNPLLVRRPGTQISMTPSQETACARPPPPEGPPPL